MPSFSGPEWSKVRGLLQAKEAFTFWISFTAISTRFQCPMSCVPLWCTCGGCTATVPELSPTAVGGYRHAAPLVQQVLCQKIEPNWREFYRQVAAVGSSGACQQCGGVHEQRVADAPIAASDAESGNAGPEATVLEHKADREGNAAAVPL